MIPDGWCGIIVDGAHTDPVVLRIALKCKPHERFMLVTDAMPSVGTNNGLLRAAGPAHHGERLRLRRRGRDARGLQHRHGELRAQRGRSCSGVPLPTPCAWRASTRPSSSGSRTSSGASPPGYRANLVLADDELNVLGNLDRRAAVAAAALRPRATPRPRSGAWKPRAR